MTAFTMTVSFDWLADPRFWIGFFAGLASSVAVFGYTFRNWRIWK